MTGVDVVELLLHNNNTELEMWTCCYCHKKVSGNIIRNLQPLKVKVHYQTYNVRDIQESIHNTVPFYPKVISDNEKSLRVDGKCSNREDHLMFFYTEDECNDYYNSMLFQDIENMETEKIRLEKQFNNRIAKLKKSFINSDYLIEKMKR